MYVCWSVNKYSYPILSYSSHPPGAVFFSQLRNKPDPGGFFNANPLRIPIRNTAFRIWQTLRGHNCNQTHSGSKSVIFCRLYLVCELGELYEEAVDRLTQESNNNNNKNSTIPYGNQCCGAAPTPAPLFSFNFAPPRAPFPALYCRFKMYYNSSNIRNMSQGWQ